MSVCGSSSKKCGVSDWRLTSRTYNGAAAVDLLLLAELLSLPRPRFTWSKCAEWPPSDSIRQNSECPHGVHSFCGAGGTSRANSSVATGRTSGCEFRKKLKSPMLQGAKLELAAGSFLRTGC